MLRLLPAMFVLAVFARPSAAQVPRGALRGPAPSQLFAAHPSPGWAGLDSAPEAIQPTHWKRGLLIGGAVGAVGLGGIVYAACQGLKETQESCLGPALGGAALGAVTGGIIGGLIGGAFPKQSRAPVDSIAPTP